MKKNYFLLKTFLLFTVFLGLNQSALAQTDYYDVLVGTSTSGNGRAPQGSRNISRSVFLITQAEMTAAGFTNGNGINSLAFFYSVAQDIATAGNMTVYLQNSADATNTKSTTWATAITGMTTVSNASLTIPNTVGSMFVPFSGGSAFTYTGGSLYVAFDYQNLVNPVATVANTVLCNTALTNGLKGAMSAAGSTVAPTTIAASSFRPIIKLGKPSTCSMPINLSYNQGLSTLNSATASWFSHDGGTNFQIEYGPYNFTQGTGTTVSVTTNPYTITGLLDSTVYDFFVRKDCGGGVFSNWNVSSLATQFVPVTPPYTTSFEQENLNFIGWSNPSNTLVAGDWSVGNYGAGALVQDGLSSVVSVTPAAAAANNFMFSRGINLTAGSTVTVSFYISNFVNGSTNTGSYQLTWGTNATAASQTNVIGGETGLNVAAFTLKTYNFIAPTTGLYYLGLRNQSPLNAAGTHALIIDNLSVSQVLSSESFTLSGVKMYPNPAKDVLNIQSDIEELTKVSITDLNGRVIKEVTNNLSQISLGDLAKGIYMVTIESATAKKVEKLIVE